MRPPSARASRLRPTFPLALTAAITVTVAGSLLAASPTSAEPIGGPVSGPISAADTTSLISVGADGAVPNDESGNPAMSRDGRFVVFTSDADNLVADDTNGVRDVFWRDQATGETRLVSRADGADGAVGNANSGGDTIGGSGIQQISGDGRFVVFGSAATNLTDDATVGTVDVYVRDVVADETTLASRTDDGDVLDGGSRPGGHVDISEDGRFVAFVSSAANLPGTRDGDLRQVYLRDLLEGRTTLVSRTRGGVAGDGDSQEPSMSLDGSKVAFVSDALNLGALEESGFAEDVVVVRDLAGNRTSVESRLDGPDGEVEVSFNAYLAGNGTHVGWTDGGGRTFNVRDLSTGETVQAAVLTDGALLPGFCCYQYAISDDAQVIAAYAGDEEDTVYRRDLRTGITTVVSRADGPDGVEQPSTLRSGLALSGDGRFVAFGSTAPDLAPGDYAGEVVFPSDVFVRDVTGPPALEPSLTPVAGDPLAVRASCGAALCEATITGEAVLQRSADGDRLQTFALDPASVYLGGGETSTITLGFPGTGAEEIETLLRDARYGAHSRLELRLDVAGETGAGETTAAVRLGPDQTRTKPKLTLSAQPRRDRRAPYAYLLKGRLKGSFARSPEVCRGKVAVTVRQGRRTVSATTARLRPDCTYRARITIPGKRVRGRGVAQLRVAARYAGNGSAAVVVLTPARAALTVRAR